MLRPVLTAMLLIAHVGMANAATELSLAEMDEVSAGGASATAIATALGNNVATSTFTLASTSLVTDHLAGSMHNWLQGGPTLGHASPLGLSSWFQDFRWNWQQ
jgi:hypothetical protein